MSRFVPASESIASYMQVPDSVLAEEFEVAVQDVGDRDAALEIVAETAGRLFVAARQQIDNRRRRAGSAAEPGHYKPFNWQREMLRLNLLAVIDEFERDEDRMVTSWDCIKTYARLIVKTGLNQRPFWSAVGMAHVLCDYTAQETLDIFRVATEHRLDEGNWGTCSVIRGKFFQRIIDRFGADRVHIRKERGEKRLNVRYPSPEELAYLKRWLRLYAPPLSGVPQISPSHPRLGQLLPRLEEGQADLSYILQLLDPERFAAIAAQATGEDVARAFDGRARILDIQAPDGPGPVTPDRQEAALTESDFERLRRRIEKHRNRAKRRMAGSLVVCIDGFDRATIDDQKPTCHLLLEEGASIVDLIASDELGSFNVGSYILTYGSSKSETWDIDVTEDEAVCAAFEYRDDDSVLASFGLDSLSSLSEEHARRLADIDFLSKFHERKDEVRDCDIRCSFGCGSGKTFGMLSLLTNRLNKWHIVLEYLAAFYRQSVRENPEHLPSLYLDVADWRMFPLASALTAVLQSGPKESIKAAPNADTRWIINTISECDLVSVITAFGEERRAKRMARGIMAARPFDSPVQLAHAVHRALEISPAVPIEVLLAEHRSGGCMDFDE